MRETRTPVVAISLSGSRRSFSLTADKGGADVSRRDRGVCGVGAKRQISQPPSALGKAAASTLSPSVSGGRQSAHGDPNGHRPGQDERFSSRAQGCGVPCESSQGSSRGAARQQGTPTRQAHPAARWHSPRPLVEERWRPTATCRAVRWDCAFHANHPEHLAKRETGRLLQDGLGSPLHHTRDQDVWPHSRTLPNLAGAGASPRAWLLG